MLRQFRLGPANICVQQLANVAQPFRYEVAHPRDLTRNGIRFAGEQAAGDCLQLLFPLVDSLDQRWRMPARSHGADQVPEFLLNLLRSLPHVARLVRQLRQRCSKLAFKFLEGVIDGVGLNDSPLEFREQAIFEPVGTFLELITACPTVEVLRAAVAGMPPFASTCHDNQICTAGPTLQETSQEVLARRRPVVQTFSLSMAKCRGNKSQPGLHSFP